MQVGRLVVVRVVGKIGHANALAVRLALSARLAVHCVQYNSAHQVRLSCLLQRQQGAAAQLKVLRCAALEVSRTTRSNGARCMSSFVDFWYFFQRSESFAAGIYADLGGQVSYCGRG